MKTRKDFVTNSSSTCYICEICGELEEAYDRESLSRCENGHTFDTDCLHGFLRTKYPKEWENDDVEMFDDKLKEKYCPICTLAQINDDVVLDYLMYKFKLDINDIHKEICEGFKDLDSFMVATNPLYKEIKNPRIKRLNY